METATGVLRSAHAALGKMLNFTESLAERIRRGAAVQPEVLGKVIEFFRVFLDDCLLTKEENVLFPMLETKGISRQSGPISLTHMQHETGRRLLREMGKASADYDAGNSGVPSDNYDASFHLEFQASRSSTRI